MPKVSAPASTGALATVTGRVLAELGWDFVPAAADVESLLAAESVVLLSALRLACPVREIDGVAREPHPGAAEAMRTALLRAHAAHGPHG